MYKECLLHDDRLAAKNIKKLDLDWHCYICNLKFRDYGFLSVHKEKKHNKCNQCGVKISTNLDSHVKRVHPIKRKSRRYSENLQISCDNYDCNFTTTSTRVFDLHQLHSHNKYKYTIRRYGQPEIPTISLAIRERIMIAQDEGKNPLLIISVIQCFIYPVHFALSQQYCHITEKRHFWVKYDMQWR